MNSKKPNGSDKGKGIANPDSVTRDMSGLGIEDQQDAGWEVISKKNRNRSGNTSAPHLVIGSVRQPTPYMSSAPQQKGGSHGSGRGRNGTGSGFVNLNPRSSVNLSPNSGPTPNQWPVTPDPHQPHSRVNPRPQLPPPQQPIRPANTGVQPPLTWAPRARMATGPQFNVEVVPPPPDSDPESNNASDDNDDDDDDDLTDDSDDDLSDDYDSDASQKSHGTRKQNKWFKPFFDELDRLKVHEINEQTRQWHCPACANGPGAIDWYKGLQPLMTHAKTKGATRVKLHRELATLLEEELRRRGTSVIPVGEQYGKWQGLKETATDHEIVWPPMVVITNTFLDTDDNNKSVGMGNQELLDYFSSYDAKKARHSYGPKGHRGISLLIFESDAVGYMEAERLHKNFEQQGTDRYAWEAKTKSRFLPGGQRQLFGFLAIKDDLEDFNRHCKGKTRLKYEMRSYQEMVVGPMKQMNEDNQQLHWLQRKVVKQEQRSKVIEQSFDVVSKRLRDSVKSVDLVRERTRKHHEETKEEMDNLEHFFKEQIEKVHKATEEKEKNFQNQLQEERSKATQSDIYFGSNEDRERRNKEIELFIDNHEKGVEEFEAEKERLMKMHEMKKVALKREYLAKEVELEKQLDTSLTALMEKFKPSTFHASSSSM